MATHRSNTHHQAAAAIAAPASTQDPHDPGYIDGPDFLTTNQGLRLRTDQHSLKAGERGSSLLEDFHLREKITHFDHERIPERTVHARGSAAHSYFQTSGGKDCPVDHSILTVSSTMFDAIAIPGGMKSVATLAETPGVVPFITEAYRHLKTIGLSGEAAQLFEAAGIAPASEEAALGIVVANGHPFGEPDSAAPVRAIAKHRHWNRAVPPKADT